MDNRPHYEQYPLFHYLLFHYLLFHCSKFLLRKNLARLEGVEPPTYRFEVCRSVQLSYRRVIIIRSIEQ